MANKRVASSTLIPVGLQVMSLTTTAVSLNSTVRGPNNEARVLDISVETTGARFRSDGTNPTNTTGVALPASTYMRMTGYNGSTALKFIRAGGTGTSTVTIQSYKYVGD